MSDFCDPSSDADEGQITRRLRSLRVDQAGAIDELLPMVYQQLKHIARSQLKRQNGGLTLNTTELVHEAYLKLGQSSGWQSSGHFFAVATRAMRQIMIDFARARCAQRRGSGRRPLNLDQVSIAIEDQAEVLLELDQRLSGLARHDERLVRLIDCRFFGGLNERETADALGLSVTTVQRDWTRARAWFALQSKLGR